MRLSLVLLGVILSPLTAWAQAPNCSPTRMMIVLDKSSSMNGVVDGQTKWEIATQAVTKVANDYQNTIDLGLNVFPNPNQCAPGKTVVIPGPGKATEIINALGAAPPAAGNYTPMAQSLDEAANDPALSNPNLRPAILLITDGWQWCDPYDPATRTLPIDAVERAVMKGIRVFVVGFGDAVDVATLNKMAVAAGTAITGCNATGSTVASPDKCYRQADNALQLETALNTVAVQASAEICDGLDNDCNGQIDEGLQRGCANACGAGEETCTLGVWGGCDAPQPASEICDGKDNDCNGTADEGCMCDPGETRSCGGLKGACAMKKGTQTCLQSGTWGSCQGAATPEAEICNGIDDDCDGMIDNGSTAQLCPNGGVCASDGKCHEEQAPPSTGGVATGQPDGCGCSLGAASPRSAGLGGSFLLLCGLALLLIRRRA